MGYDPDMSWGNAFKGLVLGGLPGAAIGAMIGNDGDDDNKPVEAPSHDSWGKNYARSGGPRGNVLWDQSQAPDSPGANWTPTATGLGGSYGSNTATSPNRQPQPPAAAPGTFTRNPSTLPGS